MKKENLAVLLTCHNRKNKTIACLQSFYNANIPSNFDVDVYLTDDGSIDGTSEAISEMFPLIKLIKGDGNLYWAGGMRLTWVTAMKNKPYDIYLLLNDDVVLRSDFFDNFQETANYALKEFGMQGIYSGSTIDMESNKVTYGASRIKNFLFVVKSYRIEPTNKPQKCDITNSNILWVDKEVVNTIGVFDTKYTHGIADYDYSIKARKRNIPVLLTPGVCGVCVHDHRENWRNNAYSLRERIDFLKSPKGLAYKEYMYYIGKHFPFFLPYSFIMLWMKTLFPFLWERYKL
ncbi:MAG: glycosyltransferase family 2 protein [Fermentimonas sp.]|nr:glycosyltransferase family 2 protein [Fermentimonas sp.]